MDLFTTLAMCAALASPTPPTQSSLTDSECQAASLEYQSALRSINLSGADRDAIARVAFAEAANQGDSGLAGVVYTILNRLLSGQWGNSINAVVNAPHQFEPVHTAGGWRELPPLSPVQQSRVDTIINLALDGRLPDLTNGALFFQNPQIVANREAQGEVSEGLTHFGGSSPSAVIKDHTFYASINKDTGHSASPVRVNARRQPPAPDWDVYGQARDQGSNQSHEWDVFGNGNIKEGVLVNGQEDR